MIYDKLPYRFCQTKAIAFFTPYLPYSNVHIIVCSQNCHISMLNLNQYRMYGGHIMKKPTKEIQSICFLCISDHRIYRLRTLLLTVRISPFTATRFNHSDSCVCCVRSFDVLCNRVGDGKAVSVFRSLHLL